MRLFSGQVCHRWRITSVSKRLFPQKIAKFLGPGLLDILARALERVRVARFPLAEPDLEFRGRIRDNGGQTDVRRLNAMFVDVNVKILEKDGKHGDIMVI